MDSTPKNPEPGPPATFMHSARIDAALRRRVRRYLADADMTKQDFTIAALVEYLDRHEKEVR